MADLYIAEQSAPTTPSAGNLIYWADSSASLAVYTDDAGRHWAWSRNASVADQGAGFASDTYVTGSNVLIPSFGFQTKTVIRWVIAMSKTAAGVAGPVYNIRIGANGTTADTARLSITGPTQTAAADNGILTIQVTVRTAGAACTLQGYSQIDHTNSGTGFAGDQAGIGFALGASFDASAVGGQYIGLSINAGASAAWTLTQATVDANW